jgi:hypothetical protein
VGAHAEHIRRPDCPVDSSDISEIRRIVPGMGEDAGEVESAIPREERLEPETVVVVLVIRSYMKTPADR